MPPNPTHALLSLPEYRALPEELQQHDKIIRLCLLLLSTRLERDMLKAQKDGWDIDDPHFSL